MEDLEEKQLVTIKEYNKKKIYYLNQAKLSYNDDVNENSKENVENCGSMDQKTTNLKTLQALELKCKQITEELTELKSNHDALNLKLKALSSQLSNEEIAGQIDQFKQFLHKNKSIKDCEIVEAKEFNSRKDELNKFKKVLAARNKSFKSICDAISDLLGISKKQLLIDAGIEE